MLTTTLGPNELSVNIPKAVRFVYKLDRGSFYAGRYSTSNFEECCLKDLYIGTPAKADSLITIMDRSVHSHRRQVIQVTFHTTTADSRFVVSKAWTRAVTGDAMYSYIPSTQVRYSTICPYLMRIYMWNRNASSNYLMSSVGKVHVVNPSTPTTGSTFSSCKYFLLLLIASIIWQRMLGISWEIWASLADSRPWMMVRIRKAGFISSVFFIRSPASLLTGQQLAIGVIFVSSGYSCCFNWYICLTVI